MTEEVRQAGKFGMKSFDTDEVKLKLGSYLNINDLPPLPDGAFGHVYARPPGGEWGMLGNNRYGDCVMAGAAHEEMHWARSTVKAIPNFNDKVVVDQYLQLSGGIDSGLDPVEAAKYRRNFGLRDANGNVYKIEAFALIKNLAEFRHAVHLFDLAAIGFFLPNSAERTFSQHRPWTDTSEPANSANGHYVPIIGRNAVGLWVGITWNGFQGVSEDFLQKYCFGCGSGGMAYFSKNYLKETGQTPEGFDAVALNQDLLMLTRSA